MRGFAIGVAYLCIYTTPIQIFFIGWIIFMISQTEYGIFTLSTKIFLVENLKFLHDWVYSWVWNPWLDFWYKFPALIMTILKTVFSTWLGFWLLKRFK